MAFARRMLLRSMVGLLASLAAVALSASRSAAQDSTTGARPDTTDHAYRYRLLGVYDARSGQPVADAEVIDALSGTSARTSRTGTVSLFFLPEGGSLVRIRKVGYAMQTMVVAISPADTVPLTVVLQPAVQLPEVVTTGRARYLSPNLRGFEERRRIGMGYIISDSVLRKEEYRTLGNVLLSHIPGIQVDDGRQGTFLYPSPRCTSGGPPDVYLDGVPLSHLRTVVTPGDARRLASGTIEDTQPIDISMFQVSHLAGVEYYPDGNVTPAEFSFTSKACGVLLLWTRER